MPGLLKDLPNRDMTVNLPGPTYTIGADGMPTIEEKLVDPIIPAVPDNLICLDGCKHYCDCVLDSDDLGEGRELVRYCKALSTGMELMELTDGAVYGCSFYAPPWWSWTGWKRKRSNTRYLKWARQRVIDNNLENESYSAGAEEEIEVYDE